MIATAKQARPTTKFDEIRLEIVEWLNTDLLTRLKPPSTVVFHEVLYAGSQVPSNFNILNVDALADTFIVIQAIWILYHGSVAKLILYHE